MNRITLSLALSVALAACGGSALPADGGSPTADGGGSAPACGRAGRTGETACPVTVGGTCPAGQYCDMEMLTCTAGCTADDDCAADEQCIRAAGQAVGACEPCPSCGDGTCGTGEDATSCPADCASGPTCGDGSCDAGETPTSCPADCASGPTCGDGSCDAGETSTSSRADCTADRHARRIIDADETRNSCPADCASGPTCGDGSCDAGETSASCPADCASGPTCGDGSCNTGETYAGCPGDCGNLGLADCFQTCDDYAFFDCVSSSDACSALCESATPPQRQSFLSCANTVDCSTYGACLPRLQ